MASHMVPVDIISEQTQHSIKNDRYRLRSTRWSMNEQYVFAALRFYSFFIFHSFYLHRWRFEPFTVYWMNVTCASHVPQKITCALNAMSTCVEVRFSHISAKRMYGVWCSCLSLLRSLLFIQWSAHASPIERWPLNRFRLLPLNNQWTKEKTSIHIALSLHNAVCK